MSRRRQTPGHDPTSAVIRSLAVRVVLILALLPCSAWSSLVVISGRYDFKFT